MSCGTPVFSDTEELVPVMCALTDKLVSRTDCLFPVETWDLLRLRCTPTSENTLICQVTRDRENQDRVAPPPVQHKASGEQTVQVEHTESMKKTTPDGGQCRSSGDRAHERLGEVPKRAAG